MRIAFPTKENKGLESTVYTHFGSAPVFVVVDSEEGGLEILDNQDLGHEHGNCQPLAAIGGTLVDAVVVGGIGGGALKKLANAGASVPNQGWERLTPIVPTPADRSRLGLRKSDAAFFLERLGARDDVPIEWRTTIIRGDRYRFVTDWSAGGRTDLRPSAA